MLSRAVLTSDLSAPQVVKCCGRSSLTAPRVLMMDLCYENIVKVRVRFIRARTYRP